MNKQRKTSHILNVFQYDVDGHVVLPASLTLTVAPASNDNSGKVGTTAWVRSYVTGLSYLTGNQSISVSGDATGSGTTSIALTLANTTVTPGTYGSTTLVPVVTVDSKGRITSVTTAAISGSLTFTGDITGTGTTGTSTAMTLAASGVTAGTYTKVTVDTKGRVTVGASATTSDISEGTNLYYTDARVLTYLTANTYATQSYVGTQIANLVASAPATLNTLNELATALGNDPNFATTVSTSIGTKVPQTRTITINGTALDLSADRTFTIAAGVTSFNTRQGAITLSSSDVTGALGFTPYNATNPSGYITGITSSNVTTALGFTPVTNARTITINGTGYDLSADRSFTVSASDATKLPLTGGTITGTLSMATTGTNYIRMGVFPNSTSNSGEAWIGRASDRNAGTMTVQLGGGTASSRSFEVVDYAWSVVLFSVGSNGNISASGSVTASSFSGAGTGLTGTAGSLSIGGNAATATYATNSTRLYASDGVYVYGGAAPYYMSMTYDGTRWFLQVNPATPSAVRVSYADTTGTAASISGFNNPTTAATANTIAYRDASGDLYARYFLGGYVNTSDNVDTGTITHIMAKFGDNYHRSATAAKVQSFLGLGSLAYSSATIPTNNNQLTNGAGYITSSGSISGNAATSTTATYVASPDGGRNAATTSYPNTNPRTVRFDFATAGSIGGSGNYGGVMTYTPWDGTSASTGDSSYQLAFLNETGLNASGVPGLSIRNGINSAWNGTWYRIITSGNIGSQSVSNATTAGGLAVHTGRNNEADKIVRTQANGYILCGYINSSNGNENNNSNADRVWGTNGSDDYLRTYRTSALSVGYAASAGSVSGLTLTSSANGINPDSVTQNQIGYNTSVSLFGQTDGGLYSSAYSSSWVHQIYGDFRTGQIAIRGKNNGTWQGWRTVVDSSNVGNYKANGAILLWAQSHPNDYYLVNNWTGTYWRITSNHPSGVQVAYADSAGSAPANGGTSSNTNSISNATGNGHTWTGLNYFETNNGGQAVNNSNSAKLQAYSSGNNSAFMSFHKGGHFAINFGLDNDNVMRIGGWSAGANRWQLDMSGNMTVAGDVTAYSDARVKENVHTVENALDKTLRMRGVTYNRTDSDDKKTKVGVIAQEMLEVLPEVVNQDNAGMYNVSYGNIVGVLVEAIKEQQGQIEELKTLIYGLTR